VIFFVFVALCINSTYLLTFVIFGCLLYFAVTSQLHIIITDSNMATDMRITIFISLVLVLTLPSRIFSAQLPVPVTCLQRCPVTDADCIDACQREIETESEIEAVGIPAGDKRASAFVRIGRPAMKHRSSSFIRIGKKEIPVDVLDENKRKDSFVRIGRASAFVRIGRGGQPANMDDLKRASSFVRIGKSSETQDSPIEVETTGNSKRSSAFVRIGRDNHGDQRWPPIHL